MKLKFILLILIITVWGCANGQDAKSDRLQSFMKVVAESKVPVEKIISDYICSLPAGTDDKTKKNYDFVVKSVSDLQKQIQFQDSKNFIIKKYNELPSSEQRLLLKGDTKDDVCVVYFNNKYLISVLFNENRIASFVTLNKGTKSVFLLFCPK